jgi:hypothetical protein
MHDEFDRRMNAGTTLADALRKLPAPPPPRDGWQHIAAQIKRKNRRRAMLRIAVPAALAAGLAIVIGLPFLRHTPAPATHAARPAVAQNVRAPASGTDALRTQSQRLQAWVQTLDRNGAPLNGDALANAVALQDRIGLIDLQLSAARDPAARAALWQQRIGLLQQLGLVHLQPYAVADRALAARDQTMIL